MSGRSRRPRGERCRSLRRCRPASGHPRFPTLQLEVEERELVAPDGASLGRIKEFGYEASDGEGSGTLELTLSGESEETVTLQKAQK